MASYADRTLDRVPSTSLSGQWHGLAYAIADEWRRSSNNSAPQWFVDEPSYDCDDTTLSATEATGYILLRELLEATRQPSKELTKVLTKIA